MPNVVEDLTRVQADTGAQAMSGPMTSIPDELRVADEALKDFAAGTGLNGPYLAQILVTALTHENMGVGLYRCLEANTANPMMQPQYAKRREESSMSVRLFADLIQTLGGNPFLVNPVARFTEILDGKMVETLWVAHGSTDASVLDAKALEVAMLASYDSVFNCDLLEDAGMAAKQGEGKDAIMGAAQQLRPVVESHLRWSRKTLQSIVGAQVKSGTAQLVIELGENLTAKAKGALRS